MRNGSKLPPYKQRAVDALTPYPRNARTHSDAQVRQIADSIEHFGFTNPVLVNGQNQIIAGHGRVQAARLLGMVTVPTLCIDYLTPDQVRAYVIADNKTAANAGWDDDLLRLELGDLRDAGFDLTLTGFDLGELQSLFGGPPTSGAGAGSLSERFLVPPFTVLNAREGWWQERKRAWLALGIQSELGREGDMKGTPPHGPTVQQNADGSLAYRSAVRSEWDKPVKAPRKKAARRA